MTIREHPPAICSIVRDFKRDPKRELEMWKNESKRSTTELSKALKEYPLKIIFAAAFVGAVYGVPAIVNEAYQQAVHAYMHAKDIKHVRVPFTRQDSEYFEDILSGYRILEPAKDNMQHSGDLY